MDKLEIIMVILVRNRKRPQRNASICLWNVGGGKFKIQLKFNYPDIVSIPDETMEAKLTFSSGEPRDLELNCIASPFLVAKFPAPQIETAPLPLMADNLKLGEINMDDINYHALIIGINNYDSLIGNLKTSINKESGQSIISVLFEKKFMDEFSLAKLVAESYGLNFQEVNPENINIE